jgi:drug/metabolite transporter (DMT)-like permease
MTLLAILSMIAFAANSIFARAALGDESIDPSTFTIVRLASGAGVLLLIAIFKSSRAKSDFKLMGSWESGAFLLVYALTFSYAYIDLGAATGALILFAVVQSVTLFIALKSGERPGVYGIAGLLLAGAGMLALLGPRVSRPEPIGAALMMISGFAWAGYTLRGRDSTDPILVTAGNFVRSVPMIVIFCIPIFLLNRESMFATSHGILFATISGAITSAIGYTLWYTVLPSLSRSQSGVVQMAPAPFATIGGLLLLNEAITFQIILASLLVLGGVVIGAPQRRRIDSK